jgi:hypothetical protein
LERFSKLEEKLAETRATAEDVDSWKREMDRKTN